MLLWWQSFLDLIQTAHLYILTCTYLLCNHLPCLFLLVIAPRVNILDSLIPNTKSLQLICKVKGYPKPKIVWTNSEGDELPATVSFLIYIELSKAGQTIICNLINVCICAKLDVLISNVPYLFSNLVWLTSTGESNHSSQITEWERVDSMKSE